MTWTQTQILLAAIGLALAFVTSAWVNAVSRLTKARALRIQGSHEKKGLLLVQMAENPRPFLASTVVVMLFCRVSATVLITVVILRSRVAIPEVIAILVTMFVLLQLTELAPRSWVLERPDQVLLFSARPVYLLGRAFGPIASFLVAINRVFLLILPGRGVPKGPLTSEEEVKAMIEVAESEDVIEAEEAEMIESIFEFGDTVVREVMIPRPDMVCADSEMPLNDLLDLALKRGFSRIPVIRGDIDNVAGIAYTKDAMKRLSNGVSKRKKAADIVREAVFVPESKKLIVLLKEMRLARMHLAIVVDEYGGTAGLVTMEDVLEEIVGEISDEYDREEPWVEVVEEGVLRVDGRLLIDELNEKLSVALPNEEWDSVAGLVGGTLGRVAAAGDTVSVDGVDLEVERVKGRRILKVLVKSQPDASNTQIRSVE